MNKLIIYIAIVSGASYSKNNVAIHTIYLQINIFKAMKFNLELLKKISRVD